MNQRYAVIWLDHLRGKEVETNAPTVPLGSLGRIKHRRGRSAEDKPRLF